MLGKPPVLSVTSDKTIKDLTILVVGGVADDVNKLARLLADLDVKIVKSFSAGEAMNKINKKNFFLVVMTDRMPDSDSYEMAALIKSTTHAQSTAVMLIASADTDINTLYKGFDCGAADIIVEPVDPVIFCAKVKICIDAELQRHQFRAVIDELEQAGAHTRSILRNVTDGIIEINDSGIILYANPSAGSLLGYLPSEMLGSRVTSLFTEKSKKQRDWLTSSFYKSMSTMVSCKNVESLMYKKDGSAFVVDYSFSPFYDKNQLGGVFLFKDITEKIKANKTLTELATHDPLTKLPNRTLCMQVLKNSIGQAKRHAASVTILFIDLDYFKIVNDELGHECGDELLQQVAGRLKSVLRDADTLARFGGDEFIVVLDVGFKKNDAEIVARKLVALLATAFTIKGKQVKIGASIGISEYPADAASPDDLIKAADTAMYSVKKNGKQGYQFYTANTESVRSAHMQLRRDLRDKAQSTDFHSYFQPVVDSNTKQFLSAEALARWLHPKNGLLCPVDFIPLAEEVGMIHIIDEWILRGVCKLTSDWLALNILPSNFRVAVNISEQRITMNNLSGLIAENLKQFNLSASNIEIEISESTLVFCSADTMSDLVRLTDMGINIVISNFGTGFNSLNYLRKLPIQKVKINGDFVHNINVDVHSEKVLIAAINLAHSLGLRVVAECVETVVQCDFLSHVHCDYMQGFLFSKPLPFEAFLEYAHSQHDVGKNNVLHR